MSTWLPTIDENVGKEGYRPCTLCGKRHVLRADPLHPKMLTWADADDDHPYRQMSEAEWLFSQVEDWKRLVLDMGEALRKEQRRCRICDGSGWLDFGRCECTWVEPLLARLDALAAGKGEGT